MKTPSPSSITLALSKAVKDSIVETKIKQFDEYWDKIGKMIDEAQDKMKELKLEDPNEQYELFAKIFQSMLMSNKTYDMVWERVLMETVIEPFFPPNEQGEELEEYKRCLPQSCALIEAVGRFVKDGSKVYTVNKDLMSWILECKVEGNVSFGFDLLIKDAFILDFLGSTFQPNKDLPAILSILVTGNPMTRVGDEFRPGVFLVLFHESHDVTTITIGLDPKPSGKEENSEEILSEIVLSSSIQCPEWEKDLVKVDFCNQVFQNTVDILIYQHLTNDVEEAKEIPPDLQSPSVDKNYPIKEWITGVIGNKYSPTCKKEVPIADTQE